MPTIVKETGVAAPPDLVWSLVSDPGRIPLWNPMAERVVGGAAVGDGIELIGDEGSLHAVVEVKDQVARVCQYKGASPMPGMGFTGAETVIATGSGSVYHNEETLSGAIATLLFPFLRRGLARTYQQQCDAPKAYAAKVVTDGSE